MMVLFRRWMRATAATPCRLEMEILDVCRVRMITSMRMSCNGYHGLSMSAIQSKFKTASVFPINHYQSNNLIDPCMSNCTLKLHSSSSSNTRSYSDHTSPINETNLQSLSDGNLVDDSLIPSMIDREIDIETDNLLSHLRVNLYSVEEDSCGTLLRLYEAASVQEVFEIIESAPEVNLKFSSQALVTLWDMQKLLFKLGPLFDPENDLMNKAEFIYSVRRHPTFINKILQPVVEYHNQLEDEPLCASLMCLKRLGYSLLEFEPLIEECIRRKNTLALTGLSRLSVSLRFANLYGSCIMANFMPLSIKYIDSMSSDMDVRLVSITLKGMVRLLSEDTVKKYLSRISGFVENGQDFSTATYVKIFLTLMDMGNEANPLLRILGTILASRVSEMEVMDILLLQKFLLSPIQEPYSLLEALVNRNLRILEGDGISPRLDSLACVSPYLKNIQKRKQLSATIKNYMDNSEFESAIHLLYTILKSVRTNDKKLYNQYWSNVLKYLENVHSPRKVISIAKYYLNFTHSLIGSYRNGWFESVMIKSMYLYLNNYMKGLPGYMSPSDFAAIVSFLVAFDSSFVDVQYLAKLSDFAPQLKAVDLYFIGKGVDSALINLFRNKRAGSKNYETMIQICSILEEESALRLLQDSKSSNIELLTIARLSTVFAKVKGESPLFNMSMKKITHNGIHDSREVRETCHVLTSGNYYCPKAMEGLSEFVTTNLHYLSPETVERFLQLSYTLGWEKSDLPYEKLAATIETHWDKLGLGLIQSAMALAYFHHLSPLLVHNIFNVDFLDQIDDELSSSFGNNIFYPMKLRVSLMELNRTICLDMPGTNLPWFHDKFCQNIISQGRIKETYLQTEVFSILKNILGENAILSFVCSPNDYYYSIDFVVEFDDSNRPIRTKRKTSFFRDVKDRPEKVSRKVAILILRPSSFTKNVRSLKGSNKLKQRHLEILGYDVVQIDPYHWNSMYMSENLAKQNYLESKIFQ